MDALAAEVTAAGVPMLAVDDSVQIAEHAATLGLLDATAIDEVRAETRHRGVWRPGVTAWICARCGMQYPDTASPPASCPICEDERECVAAGGQRWTSADELARDHAVEIREEEPGLVGLGVTPSFAIGQRALLVRTPQATCCGTASRCSTSPPAGPSTGGAG